MNVEKLHSVLSVIKNDFDNHKIISKFSDFTWKMSQYSEDPSDENSCDFKSALDELNSSLEEFKCDLLVPSQHNILLQLNATHLVGRGLRQSIEDILATNAAVKADVSQQLTDLLASVNRFYERAADIIRGFAYFDIHPDNLARDEFELGFIYPAKQFELTLAKFKNEIIFVNKLLSNIYETTGEQCPETDLRSLSSGDIAIYLHSSVIVADKVMQLIKGIVEVYDTIGDIQQKSKELKLLAVSQNIIDLLKEEEKQRITLGLEKLKASLFDRGNNNSIDAGRMNELENSISIDLKQLAQKIEHGLKIEVSVSNETLNSDEHYNGVNIKQLADIGRLMTSSTFTHEPVLLQSVDKSQQINSPETDSISDIESDNVVKTSKKKKVKSSMKKKADQTEEKLDEAENIETARATDIDDSDAAAPSIDENDLSEFGWVVTDD